MKHNESGHGNFKKMDYLRNISQNIKAAHSGSIRKSGESSLN